jgi:ribonuclease-3
MSHGLARTRALREFARRIGLPRGADLQIVNTALTHESYAIERPGAPPSNQRLEFLGDAVLGAIVASRLYERYPDRREGQLSRMRAALVSRDALARSAELLGIGELLLLGRGEHRSGGAQRPSVLADAFEALVGACFLIGGMQAAVRFVQGQHLAHATSHASVDADGVDAKTKLQELTQAKFKKAPHYAVTSVSGPPHARVFTVVVTVAGRAVGRGSGTSKKQAQANAAREALAHLP